MGGVQSCCLHMRKNVPQPKSFQNRCAYLVLCAVSRDGCSSWDGKSGVI